MDADLMLAWMSATAEGDIRDLRQRVAWLARNADLNPQPFETGRWLRDMTALAHVEVDWVGGRWAMAPPVAVLLPSCGGTTVLAGCRRLGLVEELGDLLSLQTILCATSDLRLTTPTQVYLQSDSIKDLVEGLNICGVDYGGRAAEYIANRLSPLRLGEPAAPPAYSAPVKYLQLDGALRFVDGRLTSHSGSARSPCKAVPHTCTATATNGFTLSMQTVSSGPWPRTGSRSSAGGLIALTATTRWARCLLTRMHHSHRSRHARSSCAAVSRPPSVNSQRPQSIGMFQEQWPTK